MYRHDLLKNQLNSYTIDMDILENYLDQATYFLSNSLNLTGVEAVKYIKNMLESSDTKEPIVTYYKRDRKGDRLKRNLPLLEYLKQNIDNDYIITPTLTILQQHGDNLSLHSEFTTQNKKDRSIEKKKAFEYKVIGNLSKFDYHNTLQKTLKLFNNSLSGGYVSKSTIIRNEAGHSVLTSVTRCVTSIGNALTEDMVSGNRQYRNPDVTLNHITEIANDLDNVKYTKLIDKYKLHIPSNDEVRDVVLKSSDKYFKSEIFEVILNKFILGLNDSGKCGIVYNTSMYHLSIFNPILVKDIINDISKISFSKVDNPLLILSGMPEYVIGLVHHICNVYIKGMNIDYIKLHKDDPELLNILASTAKSVYDGIYKYEDIFKTLFITGSYPPSMAYIPDIEREATLVSDTDSTIATYQYWIEFMLNSLEMSPRAIGVADTVATITATVVEHFIYMFTTALNVKGDYKKIMEMKPEFFFPVFIPANVSKTYYSNYNIQEGKVFNDVIVDIKGVHLIGSNLPPKYVSVLRDMMDNVFRHVMAGKKLAITDILYKVIEIEKEITVKIVEGDGLVYPIQPIKELEAYLTKDDIQSGKTGYDTKYYNHIFWERVFKDKYGVTDTPPYSSITVTMTTKSKVKLREFLNTLPSDMKNNIIQVMKDGNKKDIPSIRVPYAYASIKGIPKELIPYIDKRRVVHNICNSFYILLETLGFYKKKDLLISDYL